MNPDTSLKSLLPASGLIADLYLAGVPILLGSGERLFDQLDGGPAG